MKPKRHIHLLFLILLSSSPALAQTPGLSYPIVDTSQTRCYDQRREIAFPGATSNWFGQDGQYAGHAPQYRNNGDGTISDLVTGLMWQADPGAKVTYDEAVAGAARCRTAGYDDWRLPSIKELYSLILFSGIDPDPRAGDSTGVRPFIDTRYFKFQYGNLAAGERIIDSQWASSTRYVGTTMGNNPTLFGVNFADGRIKGYPIVDPRGHHKGYFALYVRGNPRYGVNDFVNHGDGTVTDRATGLMWMQVDSGRLKAGPHRDGKLNWQQALAWAEGLTYAGYDDWRLPNAKELQSIVDYSRAPAVTQSPALDPLFDATTIRAEEGRRDYPFYWTSTTHVSQRVGGGAAVYLAFGSAYGYLRDPRTGEVQLMDVHGAGAQRSDPKAGDPSRFPQGEGPQGDVIRITNFVRCVRGGQVTRLTTSAVAPDEPVNVQTSGAAANADDGQAFMQRHDRDRDGKISRREFPGPTQHFTQFDRNHDGYLTAEEAPSGPPPERPSRNR